MTSFEEIEEREVEEVSLSSLINPLDRQREFLRAVREHTYVLYGGAGGGGKSYILRWTLLGLLLKWGAQGLFGVRVGLFSVDYPTLHDRQLSKIRAEFPDWLGDFHEQRKEFVLRPEYGGGVLAFRNLDDPKKYKSAEFGAIAVEELTENEESVFYDLIWRLRWPGIEDTKFIAATNPTGPGHLWVKRLWILRQFPENLAQAAPSFAFIPAKSADNHHNPKSYADKLDSLPEHLRAALRDGSWDVFSGQAFSEFRRDIQVVPSFQPPSWWQRWGGNDPGIATAGVWYNLAAADDGLIHVYREHTFQGVTYSQQAAQVKAKCTLTGPSGTPTPEDIRFWVTGMDAFNKDPETGKSRVDYYMEGGLSGFIQPIHGPGSRATRVGIMHEYLRPFPDENGKLISKLRIHDCCEKLIETLPALVTDENKPEEVMKCDTDHWFDAVTYSIAAWHARQSNQPKNTLSPNQLGRMLDHDDPEGKKGQEEDPWKEWQE